MMRQANSVVYGSDALTGVVNSRPAAAARIPALAYTIDGGNLGTFRPTLFRSAAR